MAEREVGLDVGTSAVRVAEVEPGPRPVLRAFGQVALLPGAVRGGEVVDVDAVADAIRQLWRENGLRQRTARVGVASERVVVRTIEFPGLSDGELVGALRLQAQDYVPMPVEEAVLDFHVLERVTGPEGEPVARVLVAAAHREMVGALLRAVKAAGITATGVDLLPLALIRGLRPAPTEPGSAEAIVSVDAGVTTVVVHEAGIPRLVRMVATGGDEAMEVQADLAAVTGPIHGSLDYYLNQPEAPSLDRLLLTGAGSLAAGLIESLATSLGLPVEQARPREAIDIGDIGIPEERIPDLDPYLPVAVGLAVGGRRSDGVQIDLLPPEARREMAGRRTRQRLGIAAAALLVVLASLSLLQVLGTARQRDRLASQQRSNQALQAQVDELAGALRTEQDLILARQGVTAALAGDVSWPRVLEDLAGTVPENLWLNTVSLQPTSPTVPDAAGTAASAAGAGGTMGTASFTATALDFPAVAAWLDRIPRIPYFLNLVVSSATKAEGGPRPVVTFTSSASVGPAARSDRLQRILEPQP